MPKRKAAGIYIHAKIALTFLDALESRRPSRNSRRENMQDRENIPPTTPKKIAKTKSPLSPIFSIADEKVSLRRRYLLNEPSPSLLPPNELALAPREPHRPLLQHRETQSSPAPKQSSNEEVCPENSPPGHPNAPKSKTSFPNKSRLSNGVHSCTSVVLQGQGKPLLPMKSSQSTRIVRVCKRQAWRLSIV